MLIPRIPLSWYALAALSLALGACGWGLKLQIKANGAQVQQIRNLNTDLKRAVEQRAVDQATLDRLAVRNAATARESARVGRLLADSLFKNREWADRPVPKEVQDALRQP